MSCPVPVDRLAADPPCGPWKRTRHFAVLGAFSLLLVAAGEPPQARPKDAEHQDPGPAISGAETPQALIEALESAWRGRNAAGYLRLWHFDSPEAQGEEAQFVSERLSAEETLLEIQRPEGTQERAHFEANAMAFTVQEPRARVEEWIFRFERGPRGWWVRSRRGVSLIDGLLHLSLSPQPFRADGLAFRLEDFELVMTKGALFTSPPSLGPTVLVFVGEATVTVRPRPVAEQEQLRQFCGERELKERVKAAFIRIHPEDLGSVLSPARLEGIGSASGDLARAREFYAEHVQRAFVLDARLPRSPWWLAPSRGDASVTFRTERHGTLTFSMSSAEPEAISLFDRSKRLQVCLYPREGRDTRYSEDDARTVDVLEHDLRVRFEPGRHGLEGEDTLTLRLLAPMATLQLRLHDDFRVDSIRSREGGEHLFFRVRNQDRVMVSLGPLSGRLGEIVLTVRYGGAHAPAPIEREVLQGPLGGSSQVEEDVVIEEVLVYSNQTAWYPQVGGDDYAVSRLRFDVPMGYLAVTGGSLVGRHDEGGRTGIEYRQDRPSKYVSVAVGRLREVVADREGPVPLEAIAVGRTRGDAPGLLLRSRAILRFFEEQFGPCPYPSLRLVVIEGRTPGGHSPAGMVILSQRPLLLRRMLRDDPVGFTDVPGYFLAHELAHQWWGHGVAGQNYRERWLSEAFAQYAAILWVRESLGEERFRDVMDRMAHWAKKDTDKGPIHLGHRLGHVKGDSQIYRAVVYDKGAYVLHMLRQVVGAPSFRQGLLDFQANHRFGKAGTDDLREALERASGKDLGPYFREWVFGTALPRLEVAHNTEATLLTHRTVVQMKARDLPASVPLTIAVSHRGKTESHTIQLEPEGGRWVFETPTPPRSIEVNSDRGLLAWVVQRN